MECSLYKSGEGVKVILLIIFWIIRWLYIRFATSDDATSDQALDEVVSETSPSNQFAHAPTPLPNDSPVVPISTLKKSTKEQPVAVPLSSALVQQPRSAPLQRSVGVARKISFGNKRKLFRSAWLMHALLKRKDFLDWL